MPLPASLPIPEACGPIEPADWDSYQLTSHKRTIPMPCHDDLTWNCEDAGNTSLQQEDERISIDPPICTAKTVNHIAISVSNLQRSKDWYCRAFGVRIIQESATSVLLGFGESMLVLREEGQPGTISHFMFGIDGYNAAWLQARLAAMGLDPQQDSNSFHVRDPDGLNVQVGDRDLGLSSGIIENGFTMR
jgi:catechol 2,3-dioxygenase-like lactoylglutathione lyase family enzyme